MTEVILNDKCMRCNNRECHDGENFCNQAMKENSFYKNKKLYKGLEVIQSPTYEELEKENERLTVSYETLKLHDEEEIRMLKSENAELKEINEGYCRNRDRLISIGFPNFKDCKEYAEHLTKAKDILNGLYFIIQSRIDYENNTGIADEMWRAKQFLNSEVEK